MPFGVKFDDFVIQFGGYAAAHRHNHGLSLEYLLTFLKMRDNIFRDVLQTIGTAYQCFQLCPFCFGFLDIVHVVCFQFLVQLLH